MIPFWFVAGFITCLYARWAVDVWRGIREAKREMDARHERERAALRLERQRYEAWADTRLTGQDLQQMEAVIEDSKQGSARWSA
jgi:hypothetical protein